jgi:hypothetical protein
MVMEMHKIIFFITGISFLGLAWGQLPPNMSNNIGVCLRGDGRVIPGQDLRAFTVSLSGHQELGGYFELATAVTSQYNSFAVTAPRKISIVEPKNQSFMCSKPLAPGTHSINVVISYPPDYLPYCTVTESTSFQSSC